MLTLTKRVVNALSHAVRPRLSEREPAGVFVLGEEQCFLRAGADIMADHIHARQTKHKKLLRNSSRYD